MIKTKPTPLFFSFIFLTSIMISSQIIGDQSLCFASQKEVEEENHIIRNDSATMPPKAVLIAAPLSGKNSKTGNHIVNSVKLFLKLYNLPDWELRSLNSQGDNILNAELTFQLYQQASPSSILFAPTGTNASWEYIKKYPEELHNKKVFFFNQVTASAAFNDHYPTLSSFLTSQQYFNGVMELMQDKVKAPHRIHILRLKGVPYFEELATHLKENIQRLGLNLGHEFLISWDKRFTVNDLLIQQKIQEQDWLFILDDGPDYYLGIEINQLFSNVQKIYTYGTIQPFDRMTAERKKILKNSWQSVFWHESIESKNHSEVGSCEFVKYYHQEFGSPPDFHSAFVFASMEIAKNLIGTFPFENTQLKNIGPMTTLIGTIDWDKRGARKLGYPMFFRMDGNGNETLYTKGDKYHWCPEADDYSTIPIKVF